VRDETLNVLLAVKNTTTSLLSDLWFDLVREPEVIRKLQAEVDELKGEKASYEALRDMKYIKYAVRESKCQRPFQSRRPKPPYNTSSPSPSSSTVCFWKNVDYPRNQHLGVCSLRVQSNTVLQ
jgi:hypothetical protein